MGEISIAVAVAVNYGVGLPGNRDLLVTMMDSVKDGKRKIICRLDALMN